jgi:ABC-2 type transport system ATP-binding protein
LLEIHHLTKRFGAIAAVDDISFEAAAGRVTGFLGRNGSGRSTTMRALLGLSQPTSGTATFWGRTYDESPPRR